MRRWDDDREALPLFEVTEVADARLGKNKGLFILPGTPTKPKRKGRITAVEQVVEELTAAEPKFSIVDGRLRLTT